MLRVSELPVTRWPPGADVNLHWPAAWTTYLAFIYISMITSPFGSVHTHIEACSLSSVDLMGFFHSGVPEKSWIVFVMDFECGK